MKYNQLYTNEYNNFNKINPLNEYPYNQFKRNSYYSLNGEWDYCITSNLNNIKYNNNKIIVPYPVESYLSNVNKHLNKDEFIVYRKSFTIDKSFIKDKTFIHLLGIDQEFTLIINGYVYDDIISLNNPIKLDITEHIQTHNELVIIVLDNIEDFLPKGKQSKNPKSFFYTPFSGIYYPIFIESVNSDYIEDIIINTTLNKLILNIKSKSNTFNICIKNNNEIIYNQTHTSNDISIDIPNPILWSPSNPFLYNLEISTSSDKVSSYFGLREITLQNNKFYLNNDKIFINGLLYQGYYPEGISTPSSYETIENDIKLIKELGYNTLRMHVKLEIPYFYYLCDKYGILVIQDFISSGKYNFISQTALPTIGFNIRNDKKMNKDKKQREYFVKCGERTVESLINHPSVILYNIFNEGWGQFDADNVYEHFKNCFPNILFSSVSGWFKQSKTDVELSHLYFNKLKKIRKLKKPVLLSEFGALCYKVQNHSYSNKKVIAYKYHKDNFELEKNFTKLYNENIIPYKDKLSGCIYTQAYDIETEDNGLFSYDRKIQKIDSKTIISINNKLK